MLFLMAKKIPLTILITAWNEPETVDKTLSILQNDMLPPHEVLVVAPDEATLAVAKTKKKTYPQVRTLRDKREGKPAALQMAMKAARGEVVILTDGDVIPHPTAFSSIYAHFANESVGAVSGYPVSTSPQDTMLGYWAHLLTGVADARRRHAVRSGKRFFCSGYLFGIRKNLFPSLTPDILSEDGYISHCVYEAGKKIAYEPRAKVYVKYPTTFEDWITQKRRSAGGYAQIHERWGITIRSFRSEAKGGGWFLRKVKTPRQAGWLVALFVARIYLWYRIHMDLTVRKKGHEEIWKRVETTK